jgi:predicted metal-binding membrane protein
LNERRAIAGASPMRVLDRRHAYLPVVGGIVVLAWLTLAIWEQSPYGRYLDHAGWTEIGLAGTLCQLLPAGPIVLPGLLYVSGWLLMTVGMMLPTTLPLLAMFARMTSDRSDRGSLLALLILGYLSVWAAFGLIAHAVDMALHAALASSMCLAFNGWVVGVVVLGIAGVFQFSDLKYHCLEKCRTPFSFINAHWRGADVRRQSFFLGTYHGIFCVGCCWAIMLLMFLVGTGNVGWMLAIGAVMAVEKNVAWGRRLSATLGVGLLLASLAILVLNV